MVIYKSRKFDGKWYGFVGGFLKKSTAKQVAEGIRAKRGLARVVICPKGIGCDGEWCVYRKIQKEWEEK